MSDQDTYPTNSFDDRNIVSEVSFDFNFDQGSNNSPSTPNPRKNAKKTCTCEYAISSVILIEIKIASVKEPPKQIKNYLLGYNCFQLGHKFRQSIGCTFIFTF